VLSTGNPYTVYLYTDLFSSPGQYRYLLFVTQELRDDLLYYHGSVYKNSAGVMNSLLEDNDKMPWDDNAGFRCVGTIKSIVYDRIPSHEFETNIANSLNCKVFTSESDKNTVYVETTSGESNYFTRLTKK
jgi:hypothetical protein